MTKNPKESTASAFPDITALSFEQAAKELETIVKKLESGQGDLESSIGDYTRGVALRDHCQKKLADARLKVEKIIQSGDGVATENFDIA